MTDAIIPQAPPTPPPGHLVFASTLVALYEPSLRGFKRLVALCLNTLAATIVWLNWDSKIPLLDSVLWTCCQEGHPSLTSENYPEFEVIKTIVFEFSFKRIKSESAVVKGGTQEAVVTASLSPSLQYPDFNTKLSLTIFAPLATLVQLCSANFDIYRVDTSFNGNIQRSWSMFNSDPSCNDAVHGAVMYSDSADISGNKLGVRCIQCSISNPDAPCEWCSHHDLACTFNRETQKNPKNTKVLLNDVEELFRRVESLENALAQNAAQHQLSSQVSLGSTASTTTTPTTGQGGSTESTQGFTPSSFGGNPLSDSLPSPLVSTQTSPNPTNPSPRRIQDVARYLGQNWYHKGIPILSERGNEWILSRTGTNAALNRFNLFGSKPSPTMSSIQASYKELCELPDKHIAHSILEAFFRSPFRLLYPVLDRVLFEETLTVAYDSPIVPLSHSQVSARACVLAALSIMSRSEEFSHVVQGDVYADKVQCLIGHISGEASLESLQAVLMLQMYRTFTGQWENATTLHSITCSLVCGLGGHFYQPMRPYDPAISYRERQSRHIRTLFWLCYIFDKDISLRSGLPPLLTEDYCDLTLPENYASRYDHLSPIQDDDSNAKSTYEGMIPHLPGDLGLSHIKEKACRLLYSPKAFNMADSQLLLHIRQLDDELECWRLSIPLEFRPKLSISPTCPLLSSEVNIPQRMRWTNLQLEYHYVMTAIHTSVRRCGAAYAEAGDLPDDLHQVFHSSSDLSLEASRSTLFLLKSPVCMLEKEVFWQIAFYPPVAAMSLFMNILIHPVDTQAKNDLEILASAVSIFQNVAVRTLTNDEIEHIQELNNFVTELVRLGNCAIWKARREERDELGQTPMGLE
ncbi:hypothetical protein ACJZ2D_007530 [Fusarium nematophilum]